MTDKPTPGSHCPARQFWRLADADARLSDAIANAARDVLLRWRDNAGDGFAVLGIDPPSGETVRRWARDFAGALVMAAAETASPPGRLNQSVRELARKYLKAGIPPLKVRTEIPDKEVVLRRFVWWLGKHGVLEQEALQAIAAGEIKLNAGKGAPIQTSLAGIADWLTGLYHGCTGLPVTHTKADNFNVKSFKQFCVEVSEVVRPYAPVPGDELLREAATRWKRVEGRLILR